MFPERDAKYGGWNDTDDVAERSSWIVHEKTQTLNKVRPCLTAKKPVGHHAGERKYYEAGQDTAKEGS